MTISRPAYLAAMAERLRHAPVVALLGPRQSGKLSDMASLEAHPKLGASWEGFALEQVLSVTGDRDAYFWSTHGGPELDLLIFSRGKRFGFEFKYGDAPDVTKSMRVAHQDLKLDQLFVVYPGAESVRLAKDMDLVSIRHLPETLRKSGAAVR